MDTLLPYTRAAEAGECMVAAAPAVAQVWPPSGGGKHTALEAALRHGHAYFMTWHEDMPLGLQKPQPRHARLFGFVWRC